MSRAWVINCRRLSCFRDGNANDKSGHAAPFLLAIFIPEKQRAGLFLSKTSVLLLRDMMLLYGTVTAVDEQRLMPDENDARSRALEL